MKKMIIISVFLLVSIILGACGVGGTTGSNATETEEPKTSGNETNESSTGEIEPINLTWATGAMGGGWYAQAGGMASLINEKNPNINIRVIPGGALQNIPFLSNGEADMAWEIPYFVTIGLNGEAPFDQAYDGVSAIGNGFGSTITHFMVAADSGIESIDDIFTSGENVKIALAAANNSDELLFRKILDYYNTSYDDLKGKGFGFFQGSYTEQVEQFKNHNVEVIFASGSIPSATVTDATIHRDVKILPFPEDLISYLEDLNFAGGTIPAGTYDSVVNGNEDIPSVVAQNLLVIRDSVPEDVVYEITKILNENTDRLPAIHPTMEEYNIENAVKFLGTELHPGAAKYYKEQGIIE
ncbi:hypothetical protein CD30_14530 [Ureibacillus massiliensis 4400831 = CIP 108448 = CCUG 49529]|uniref:C4-dicarboxylate ABC transporter substrate-binding protein n=1 Tax=Ureibacillus massiliensis 4400831 = CIP 108448 = CCUG 49529 TaxID=1211035 RepID=A0A0A3IYP3_9BACL|nr:TAXI family TRAP transporter solute-binding subunit [Ureibacillus massiliensis]KGR89884.1 hypothetical protein CD30_14530 [Ureibacillus massiliensis 4400831 = CIP 108448 = CCUG 49529]